MNINIPAISVRYGQVKDLYLTSSVVSACYAANTISAISGYIASCATDIENLTLLTSEIYQNIQALSAQLDTVMSSAMFRNINNVSMLKPLFYEHPLHLSVLVYENWEMVDPWEIAFDSASPDCSAYILGLFINGGRSGGQDMHDAEDAGNEVATYWAPVPDGGFNSDFNNAPVVLRLYDWIMSNESLSANIGRFIDGDIENLYIRCNWYYRELNDTLHASDSYSQIVPCNVQQTPHYIEPAGEVAALDNTSLRRSSIASISPNDDDEYVVHPNMVNVLNSGLDNDDLDTIVLADYNEMNEYKIKFVANSNLRTGGNTNNSIIIKDESDRNLFTDSDLQFESGNMYLITIVAGMIFITGQQHA